MKCGRLVSGERPVSEARESEVYRLAECHSISSSQFRFQLISSCRLWGYWAGIIHSSHVRLTARCKVPTRLYAGRGCQHENNKRKNDETIGTENGIRTPLHYLNHVIICIKVGMSCECIEIHNWMSATARNDAAIHEPHQHLLKYIHTHAQSIKT